MFEEFAAASGPADISGIDLHTVWNVNADTSYDINHDLAKGTSEKLHNLGGTGLIALRTITGCGRIYLDGHGVIDAIGDTLLVTKWDTIQRYHCKSSAWSFWWFEFTVSGPMHFPLNRLMSIPPQPEDNADFQQTFTCLRRPPFTQRSLASATFTKMLYRWIAHLEETQKRSPYQKEINCIIDMMYSKLSVGWTVAEMAEEVNMSERNFRKIFSRVTGQSPKSFYNNTKLAMAKELLRLGIYTIAQIASQLGFSSPFHFSKVFKEHFGTAPSKFHSNSK